MRLRGPLRLMDLREGPETYRLTQQETLLSRPEAEKASPFLKCNLGSNTLILSPDSTTC